jgi:hypothetical protein
MRSPLATIELEGKVECMGCGLTQAFDAVQWSEALAHAHDVADLSGPNPEGQTPTPGRSIAGRSAHARIGTEFTSSTKTQNTLIMDGRGTTKHSLRTTVSPGHPLCRACQLPLEVALDGAGGARTRCPRCNDTATYALPANAAAVFGALRGVLAVEQRTDRPIARTTRGQGGVEAALCPQCGAALAAGAGELVQCTFCRLSARVPGRLGRQQRKGEPPKADPFWVLLDGASPGRGKLLRGKSEDDDDDDDDDLAPGGLGPATAGGIPSWAHPNAQHASNAQARPRSMVGLIIGISVAGALLITAIVLGVVLYAQLEDEPEPAKTAPARPAPPAPAAPGTSKGKR